ncbi:unnamed protein product [Brassica napus]|nr:unnamed protein product [Brassica napus]
MERHVPKNCNATDLHDKKIVTGATSRRSTGHTGNRIPEKKRPSVTFKDKRKREDETTSDEGRKIRRREIKGESIATRNHKNCRLKQNRDEPGEKPPSTQRKVRRGNRSQPFFTGEEGENDGDKSRPSIMTDAMPETKTGRMRPKPVRGLNDGEGNHRKNRQQSFLNLLSAKDTRENIDERENYSFGTDHSEYI